MLRKHLIYLNNERLLSVVWRAGKTLDAQSFNVDVAGQIAFAQHVKRLSRLRVYFLVDLIEEDFRLDTIPHARGADRRQMLDRKLGQMYRATPFRHAIVLAREAAGRRDDRVLYTSITNPELLTPWLEILDSVRVPLVGIYSAPLLAVRLLKPLSQSAKHELLVTLHHGNQLRQSYTHLNKTKFSRMTSLGSQFATSPIAAIGDEIHKTWNYLESLRYLESGDSLHVCIVGNPNEITGTMDMLPRQPGLEYEFFDIAKAARAIGLSQPLSNSNAEWLLLHLLGRAPPANHFARQELTHRSLIWRLKQTAFGAGAAALLVGASLGSANLIDGRITATKVDQIRNDTRRIEQERQEIMQGLPASNVAADVMSNTVNFYNQTVKQSPDFSRAMIALSRVLSRFPQANLANLTWASTRDPSKIAANLTVAGVEVLETSDSTIPQNQVANFPVDGRTYQVFHLTGTLQDIGNNQRKALDYLAAFKQAIETDLHAHVKILARPLDTRANVSLRGTAQAIPAESDANFALKIVLPEQTR
jgi:hypothetical protein